MSLLSPRVICFPCPCRGKSAVVCHEVTRFTYGQPGKPLRQRASEACPGLACCRHPRRAPVNAAAFETILSTWACFKRAQGVLERTVTRQHHLLLSKGCLCAGTSALGTPGLQPDPPALLCFMQEFPHFPPQPHSWQCALSLSTSYKK